MAKTYLLLGSNLGDKLLFLKEALHLIEIEIGKIISHSSIYESAPWGFKHKNNFCNQVLIVNTQLLPKELLGKIQLIETKLGRVRKIDRYAERTIDIDILFYDNLVVNDKKLTIPHPELCNRMFTLAPLVEINPNLLHPVIKKTVKQIKAECKDELFVSKVF